MSDESMTRAVQGTLTPESAAVMDSLGEILIALESQPALTLEDSKTILAAFNLVSQISSAAGKSDPPAGDGEWLYQCDYPFGPGEILTLSRQGSAPLSLYFQIDVQGIPQGAFIFENKNVPAQKALFFNLQKEPDGWSLAKTAAGKQTTFHLSIPPDEIVLWENTSLLTILAKIQALNDGRAPKIAPQLAAPEPAPVPKVMAEPRFCSHCGAPLTPGMRFCGQCGAQVQAAKIPAA